VGTDKPRGKRNDCIDMGLMTLRGGGKCGKENGPSVEVAEGVRGRERCEKLCGGHKTKRALLRNLGHHRPLTAKQAEEGIFKK